MILDSYGLSDIGKKRAKNEDVIKTLDDHNFFAIADGMGGHKAGEIAAKEAIEEICDYIETLFSPKTKVPQDKVVKHINFAIEKANQKVFYLSQNIQSFRGMGTTICCLYFNNNIVTYAHVGDSRIYLFRDNKLKQLTQDHSLLKKLSLDEKIKDPNKYKNIITKAIGTHFFIKPALNFENFYKKDLYFMCTDGLSDFLSEMEIQDILKMEKSKKTISKKLIDTAKKNGSNDNISTLLIEVK
ncbi:unnamed protein product [marine sediment metagenome]|uniref:PPM-type phosphatase domain-containing protein n=1 Tax=marine sediment metagenome TaxID=412755 RepID=X0SN84_9ZZZZ